MPFIKRNQSTTDETPPWAGISFVLPVDSDELSEKLKSQYPTCSTLRQRKHQAAIDFLTDELLQMQGKSSRYSVATDSPESQLPETPQSDSYSHNETLSIDSRQASVSSCNSPSVMLSHQAVGLVDRSKEASGRPKSPSYGQSARALTTGTQQIVFNAFDGQPMQPKTKRKMTLQERSAYKETRKRGACAKCRQQKGKCTHGHNEMVQAEIVEDSKKSPKRRRSTIPGQDSPVVHLRFQKEGAFGAHHHSSSNARSQLPVELAQGTGSDSATSFQAEGQRWRNSEVPSPMYVSNPSPLEQVSISISGSQNSGWGPYSQQPGTPYVPSFREEDHSMPEHIFSSSPVVNDTPEFAFPQDFALY